MHTYTEYHHHQNNRNWTNIHWSLISFNINALNFPIKRHRQPEWMKTQDPSFCFIQKTYLCKKAKLNLRVKGCKMIFQANIPNKQVWIAILISNKIDFKPKLIKRNGKGHFILIKGKLYQENISILIIFATNTISPSFEKEPY